MKTTKPLYIALGMVLGAAVLALIAAAPDPGILHVPGISVVGTNAANIVIATNSIRNPALPNTGIYYSGAFSIFRVASNDIAVVGSSRFGMPYLDTEEGFTLRDSSGNMISRGATGVGALIGSGSPDGVITLPPGSMYLNTSGGSGTTLYLKESGAGNTGWAGVASGGSAVWTNSSTGTGSLNPAISNLVISIPSVQLLPLRIDSNSTLAVQFGLDTGHQNSSSGYKGSAFQWNMNLNSGNDSVFGVFQSQLFPGTDTYTGNRLVHAYFANDIAAVGTNMLYYGEGAVGLMGEANSTGPSSGDSIGVFGVVDSNVAAPITGFGVAGLAWDFNDLGHTMIGVAGSSILKSGINVGGYFEVSSTMTNPVFQSAALLLDNRDSGVPILIARSNQVEVASINSDGSISAGQTNQWTLGGVTNGAPHVGVDGTDYPLAALNGDGSLSVGGTLPSYFTNGVQDATLTANTLVGNDATNKLVSATAAMVATALGFTPQATNSTIGAFGATTLAATATVSLPIVMPYTGHITGWSISADGSSPTVTFDVLKEAAGGTAIPSVSIMGTKPALAAGNVVHSTAVSDWTTNFNQGDVFMIKVDTGNIVSTAVQLTLETLR